MKWRFSRIDLKMKMRCCCHSSNTYTSNHFSFSHFRSFLYIDFRKMQITRINSFIYSIYWNIIMSYYYKLRSDCISFDCTYNYTICNRKNWCSDWCAYIFSKVRPSKFFIIKLIIPHILCYVCIPEYEITFTCISCIQECDRIIEWNRHIFTDRYVLKSF